MTEAGRASLKKAYRAHRNLVEQLEMNEFEDNAMFTARLADHLRRLPADTRANAMSEILAIINRFVRVEDEVQ